MTGTELPGRSIPEQRDGRLPLWFILAVAALVFPSVRAWATRPAKRGPRR